jgi:hypothetical protein
MSRPVRPTPSRRARLLAGPAITATRDIYLRGATDLLRVAALVEVAGAAAALARTIAKHRHLDPMVLREYITDPVDLRAVLGRGGWLPTMTRHVPAPPCGPVPIGLVLPDVLDTLTHTALAVDALTPATVAGGDR